MEAWGLSWDWIQKLDTRSEVGGFRLSKCVYVYAYLSSGTSVDAGTRGNRSEMYASEMSE